VKGTSGQPYKRPLAIAVGPARAGENEFVFGGVSGGNKEPVGKGTENEEGKGKGF